MTAASLMWDLTDVSLLIEEKDFILLHADFFYETQRIFAFSIISQFCECRSFLSVERVQVV